MNMRQMAGMAAAVFAQAVFGAGNVDWSGIAPHPAVVNPVCGYEAGSVVDLGGDWEFTARPNGADRMQFFRLMPNLEKWPDVRMIKVPGCWEAQGVGDPVPASTRTVYGGHDSNFPLTHCFIGNGWYRRNVTIPSGWSGKRIWLKVGGVGCQGWFWVNDAPVAHVFDYCATRKYEITNLVEPGKSAKFVIEVSNAVPSKRGTSESVSCWGGILRALELEATPSDCFIDDVWMRGDFDRHMAEAHVTIEGIRDQGSGIRLRATVEGETKEIDLRSTPTPSTFTLEVPLRNFRAWSPEHPNLYTAKVELVENGTVVQVRKERFGVRKFEVRGRDFYLNGKPFFMRGCGFHDTDPINGRHLPDRDYCRERISKVRAAGFNLARLHTRCESPEFFEAADELGLMLQPELPYYGDFQIGMGPFEPLEDVEELYLNFRRHPSFAIYCGGNEGSFGPVMGRKFYAKVKAMDPDRLVTEQCTMAQPFWKRTVPYDGDKAQVWRGRKVSPRNAPEYYQLGETDDFISYPCKVWPRGSANPPCPMVGHEYLNLSVKADTRLADRFTGLWDHPLDRAQRGNWLKRFGLDHATGDRLQDAQHALQAIWQKRGIESARKDPHCDGYYFWSVTDCIRANEIGWTHKLDTENPAFMAQGLYNSFFEEKPNGQTAAGFAAFNSPVGVFVDAEPADFHLVSGERFAFDVLLANYGERSLSAARVKWTIVGADGAELASGGADAGFRALGGVEKIAAFAPQAPGIERAAAAKLIVTVCDGDRVAGSGSWPCWLFPRRTTGAGRDLAVTGSVRAAFASAFDGVRDSAADPAVRVVVADEGSPEIATALARGQSVIEVGGQAGPLNVELGWWFLSGIVGAVFETGNPMLGRLPPCDHLSTLHFRIFKRGRRMPVRGFPVSSLSVISEEGGGCYAHLGERVDRGGGRHIFVHGLVLDAGLPESLALIDGIVARAREPVSAKEQENATDLESPKSADGEGAVIKDVSGTGGDGRL